MHEVEILAFHITGTFPPIHYVVIYEITTIPIVLKGNIFKDKFITFLTSNNCNCKVMQRSQSWNFFNRQKRKQRRGWKKRKVREKNGASDFCHCLEPGNRVKRSWETGMASVACLPNVNWDMWSDNRRFLIVNFFY